MAIGAFEDKEVSGAYEREHKMIYIAEDEPTNRKAFTIAHEIGHYFLHEVKQHEVGVVVRHGDIGFPIVRFDKVTLLCKPDWIGPIDQHAKIEMMVEI